MCVCVCVCESRLFTDRRPRPIYQEPIYQTWERHSGQPNYMLSLWTTGHAVMLYTHTHTRTQTHARKYTVLHLLCLSQQHDCVIGLSLLLAGPQLQLTERLHCRGHTKVNGVTTPQGRKSTKQPTGVRGKREEERESDLEEERRRACSVRPKDSAGERFGTDEKRMRQGQDKLF